MRGQQFISHAIPPTVIDLEAEATAVEEAVADGGVLIYKISWVEQAEAAKVLYDTAASTLGWPTMPPEQERSVMKFDLCLPETAYKNQALASVVSLPRMGTFENWQQLNYPGAFPASSQVCKILRDKFTDVADNAWLGSLYGPTLNRFDFTLTERMAESLRRNGKFAFFQPNDDICTFTLMNDPHAPTLSDNKVHRITHNIWGTFDKAIMQVDQSREVLHSFIQLVTSPPDRCVMNAEEDGRRGRGGNYGRCAGTREVSSQRSTVHKHGSEGPQGSNEYRM